MSEAAMDRETASRAAEKLKVFAQPQRLMILSCLLRGERNVGEIDELTGIGQPALSQQLAALRRAALVRPRKEGKEVWYALADPGAELCVRSLEAVFCGVGASAEPPQPAPAAAKPATGRDLRRDGAAGFAQIL